MQKESDAADTSSKNDFLEHVPFLKTTSHADIFAKFTFPTDDWEKDLPLKPAMTKNINSQPSWSDNTVVNDDQTEMGKNAKNIAVEIDPNVALETANMLGLPVFSKSFIDRLVENCGQPRIPQESVFEYLPSLQNSQANLGFMRFCSPMDMLKTKTDAVEKDKKQNLIFNRRKTMQQSVYCQQCTRDIGLVFIRGNNKAKEGKTPQFTLACSDCETVTISKSIASKKRKRIDCSKIYCEVCKLNIGSGGIEHEQGTEELKVEYICRDCGDTYMFCSECGGGGKQRTGKWRPKELFDNGRRTCSLPHIRVGSVPVHFKVVKLSEIDATILAGIQDVFFDCFISLYCVPSVMGTAKFGSYMAVRMEIERLWNTTVTSVLQEGGEKYITLAWIHKRHRNKGSGRLIGGQNGMKDGAGWLQRLELNGIIPQLEQSQEHCYVAFSIADFDPTNRSIFLPQMASRSVFLKTMDGYLDLIKTTINHIKKDALELGIPVPKHIWCWTKSDHARLQSIPSRLRFLPRNSYLKANPDVEPEIFESDYEPLRQDGTLIYAASVSDILRG